MIDSLSNEMVARRFNPPWIFGEGAIDKALELAQGRPRQLDAAESRAVCAACPVGVWQFGTLVLGPFGLLRSKVVRDLCPTLTIGPIACSDPGCDSLHAARLMGVTCALHRAEVALADVAEAPLWQSRRRIAVGNPTRHMDDYSANSLALTLANILSEPEARSLLVALIACQDSEVRSAAMQTSQMAERFRASGQVIASRT